MRYRVGLCLLTLAALTGACTSGSPDDGKDRSSPPDSTPRTLVWERQWTAKTGPLDITPIGFEPVDFGFDRTLTVRHSGTAEVLDVATGRVVRTLEKTHGQPSRTYQVGDVLLDYRENDAEIVENQGIGRNGAMRAYDVNSGGHLWARRGTVESILHPGEEGGGGPSEAVVAFTEQGLVWNGGKRSVGLDPRTGKPTWEREDKDPGCRADRQFAATRKHSITLKRCQGEEYVLEAIDPGSGQIVWRRNLGRLEGKHFSATPDLISVGREDRGRSIVSVFDDSGKRLAEAAVSDPSFNQQQMSLMTLTGRSGKTLYFESQPNFYELGIGTDAPWRRSRIDHRLPAMLANGTLISGLLGRESEFDLVQYGRPSQSLIIDRTGRQHTLPVPGGGTGLKVVGDSVITEREVGHGRRFSALRLKRQETANPALGGVSPTDWPAACKLLSDRQLAEIGRNYARVPVEESRKVFGVGLPHPSACRFSPPSAHEKDIFQISVQWVAPDEDTARQLVEADLPWQTSSDRIRRLGPGTYLYRLGSEGEKADSLILKATGKHVLMVSGRDVDLLTRVARVLRGHARS
ncbi:hypothetical protein DVA86_07470 [Streptomyces armeniacus]|uniref:PQQ-binding-like beta-propeller repeat protein n=1 Tax=Streptomyces armeniacus TaxID=83291 RepID=A0A345XLJ9_9ACTN|nr:PQQ-binding-like beta-propeller repeat protein [Streptomyces armeniacus]AXK32515.1 hypothetical protein DVA86_07470 [Streptomyces armeniacus]